MTIHLTQELEDLLAKEARKRGTTPELLALDTLRQQFAAPSNENEEETTSPDATLEDFLDGYIGVLNSSEIVPGGANLSSDTGRKFAELLMNKRQRDLVIPRL